MCAYFIIISWFLARRRQQWSCAHSCSIHRSITSYNWLSSSNVAELTLHLFTCALLVLLFYYTFSFILFKCLTRRTVRLCGSMGHKVNGFKSCLFITRKPGEVRCSVWKVWRMMPNEKCWSLTNLKVILAFLTHFCHFPQALLLLN